MVSLRPSQWPSTPAAPRLRSPSVMVRYQGEPAPEASPTPASMSTSTAAPSATRRPVPLDRHGRPLKLPQGLQRRFLQVMLQFAKFWERQLLPGLAVGLFALTHPHASIDEMTKRHAEFKDMFRGQPNSLSNRTFRRLYPRELGVTVFGTAVPEENLKNPILKGIDHFGQDVGKAIADWGFFPVTGGGPSTMHNVLVGAKSVGAHTVGTAMDGLNDEAVDRSEMDELVLQPTFYHRIYGVNGFFHRSPRTLVLPGGFGTYREAIGVAEDLYYNRTPFPCQKQVVLLDYNGFYTRPGGLKDTLEQLVKDGLATQERINIFKYAKTLDEAREMLTDPNVPWTTGMDNHKARGIEYHPAH